MKRLGTIEVCGIRYSLVLATEEERPDLVDRWGVLDPETCEITLHDGMTADRFENTIVHEILHACFDASGMSTYLTSNLKRGVSIHDVEEQLIRGLTPALITALRGAKLLRKKVWK